jgi:hypothetical protein
MFAGNMTCFTRVPLLVASLAAACVVEQAEQRDPSAAGAGGSSSGAGGAGGQPGGAAGQPGGQGGAAAGAGGSSADPCNGVPASGRCVDAQTLERCVASEVQNDPPSVVTGACKGPTECREDADGARCEPLGECIDGASECTDDVTLRRCASGTWVPETCEPGACVSSPGEGAQCLSAAPSDPVMISGRLRYEYRLPNDERTGYGDPQLDDAKGVIVTAYDSNEYLGITYTSLQDGSFSLPAARAPTATTYLYFWPIYFPTQGPPQFGVAKPKTLATFDLEAEDYWWFGFATDGQTDVGDLVATEAQGSGALYVYQWLLYSIKLAEELAPAVKPHSVLALWNPDQRFDCANGTCYVPRGWGATVPYPGGADYFSSAVVLAGTEETPHQWSRSVMLHELGHYMMDAYSRLPNEAGPHSVTGLAAPGMAWSEGWASYVAQSAIGDPIYFDKQIGVSWWFDISQMTVNGSQDAPKPDPDGPIDQQIAELAIGSMLWQLWDAPPSGDESWDGVAIPDATLWGAISSKRMTASAYDRGHGTVDFVDFLDALRCQGVQLSEIEKVTGEYGFPDTGEPTCAN